MRNGVCPLVVVMFAALAIGASAQDQGFPSYRLPSKNRLVTPVRGVASHINDRENRRVSHGAREFKITTDDPVLVAKGKASYDWYGCYDCHGTKGEGTIEGPSLIESKLTAEEIAKTLENPSADARARGMPVIPPDSPDLPGLVAFILSLRK